MTRIVSSLACLLFSAGCLSPLAADPGGQAATAHKETIHTIYTADKIDQLITGSHQPNIRLREGQFAYKIDPETGEWLLDPDGEPIVDVTRSFYTSELIIKTDDSGVENTSARFAIEGTKQIQIMAEQFGKMMDMVQQLLPLITSGGVPPQPVGPDPPNLLNGIPPVGWLPTTPIPHDAVADSGWRTWD